MPRRSANKVTTEKTAAVSEAMPQQASKDIRKENPNVCEKDQPNRHQAVEVCMKRVCRHRTSDDRLSYIIRGLTLLCVVCVWLRPLSVHYD